MGKVIKVGIAGLGRAGRFMHTPELLQLKDKFAISALCDREESRLRELPEGVAEGVKKYVRFEDMISDSDLDLISIATWSVYHVAQAKQALEAGKYVVLDKPVALSYAEAKELAAASAKYPGKLFLRFNRRFEPAFTMVREIMARGILGNIGMVKLYRHTGYVRRFDWQTLVKNGGGMLNNWGPHLIDQALRLLDSPVKDMWSDLQHRVSAGDAEDQVKLLLRGKNGRVADVEISNVVTIPANWYEVWGDRGTLVVPAPGKVIKLKYLKPGFRLKPLAAVDGLFPLQYGNKADALEFVEEELPVTTAARTYQRGKLVDPATVDHDAGYTYQDTMWGHVYAAIVDGIPYPVTMDEALEVVRITEAARQGSGYVPHEAPLCRG